MIKITAPISRDVIKTLKNGDNVLISGMIYTGRDAAHKRMYEALNNGDALPLDLKGQLIYYCGPCPAREGQPIGSCGPTTSGRMDKYTPALLDYGLFGMIGKGARSEGVNSSIKKNNAVYFATLGGAGALLSKCVVSSEVVGYSDLGTEAIHKLEVKDFPAIVYYI